MIFRSYQRWELFNTETDPSECHDLAAQHPHKLAELVALWWSEAGKYNALPLESRNAVDILATARPQLSKPRDRYVYYPDCEEVPEAVAVNIRNRSYAISAKVGIGTSGAAGVLFAHGCRFGGHALYIKDGKLKYDYNYVGEFDQYVESTKPVPAGDCRLSASLEKSGTGTPTEGMLSLYINQEKVGEGKIKTQPGKFSLASEGVNVGMDRGEPVTADYPGDQPWPFTGGTIHKVIIINVVGDPWIDREKEVKAAFGQHVPRLPGRSGHGRPQDPRSAQVAGFGPSPIATRKPRDLLAQPDIRGRGGSHRNAGGASGNLNARSTALPAPFRYGGPWAGRRASRDAAPAGRVPHSDG